MPLTEAQYLVATFVDRDAAHSAARRLEEDLGDEVTVDDESSRIAALRADQQEEARQMWGGVGAPPGTSIQYKAGIKASIAGGVLGALLLAPLGFIPMGGIELGWRIVIAMVAGALGGSVGLASYWGGRAAQLAEDTPNAEPGHMVGIHTHDRQRALDLLHAAGAVRIDLVDDDGWPLETNVDANPEAEGRSTPTTAPPLDKE